MFSMSKCHFYRPQRSCGKVMLLHLSVSHSVPREGVYLSACWDTHPPGRYRSPWGRYTPPLQVHPPGQVHTPGQVHPWAGTPPGRYTPRQVHPLGRYTPCMQVHHPPHDGNCSGRYAPYWNAFLLLVILKFLNVSICYNLIM